jgi:hypothetical protein
MRHWHVQDSAGVSCFVVTCDLQHPRDVGYPEVEGFIAVRMVREPGAFDTVIDGVIVADSEALRNSQPKPLPQTQEALEALINARFNALNLGDEGSG